MEDWSRSITGLTNEHQFGWLRISALESDDGWREWHRGWRYANLDVDADAERECECRYYSDFAVESTLPDTIGAAAS